MSELAEGGYKVFYPNGVEFEGLPGDKPPARGVQVILQRNEDGVPYFTSSKDYYVWRSGRWWAVDQNGLYDFLLDTGLVLFGRFITDTEYHQVFQRAKGEKQGFVYNEREVVE